MKNLSCARLVVCGLLGMLGLPDTANSQQQRGEAIYVYRRQLTPAATLGWYRWAEVRVYNAPGCSILNCWAVRTRRRNAGWQTIFPGGARAFPVDAGFGPCPPGGYLPPTQADFEAEFFDLYGQVTARFPIVPRAVFAFPLPCGYSSADEVSTSISSGGSTSVAGSSAIPLAPTINAGIATLGITGGPPGSLGVFFLGTSHSTSAPLPFYGSLIWIAPSSWVTSFPIALDDAGAWSMSFPVPTSSVVLYGQAVLIQSILPLQSTATTVLKIPVQ